MAVEGNSLSRNYQFIQANLLSSLGSSSVVVKGISLALLIFYCFSFSHVLVVHLSVVPGYVLPPNFWVWTLVTHPFLQSHFVFVIVDIFVVILSGKLLEPLWGAPQLGLFFLIVTSLSAIPTAVVYMIIYFTTGNTVYLFETYVRGLGAYIGGFCVAVKQLMPDHVLMTLPFGKIRNKHIPMLVLLLTISLKLIGLLNGPYPLHLGLGILVSWIYLRYYQKHNNGSRGDFADTFTFASFFPQPVEGLVGVVSNSVFAVMVKMKLCDKPQRKYDVSSPTTITVTLPGTDPADAERRRQLAIKALNERLSKTKEDASWPHILDDDDDGLSEVVSSHDALVHVPAVPTSSADKPVHDIPT